MHILIAHIPGRVPAFLHSCRICSDPEQANQTSWNTASSPRSEREPHNTMTSRYSGQAHQRDSARTQLFAGASAGTAGSSYAGSPYGSQSSTPATPFRQATPSANGQFSDKVLSQLESQNDEQVDGLFDKVKILKDVSATVGSTVDAACGVETSLVTLISATQFMEVTYLTTVGSKNW